MKKIIITTISLFVVFFATAQTNKLASESTNTKAVAEDPHNPMVNGIPYNQYKAQQDALKQKQATQNKAVVTAAPVANAVTNTHAPAQQNMQQAPEITKQASVTAPAATTPSRLNGITATQVDMAPVPDQKHQTPTTPVKKQNL